MESTHEFSIHCPSVGISDNKLSTNNLSLYPNPAQDHLNISTSNDIKDELLITIKDVMGRTIYSGKIEEFEY